MNDSPSKDETPEKSNFSQSDYVVLKDRIKIFHGQPEPKYNNGSILAYAATEIKDLQEEGYALICDRALQPRMKQASIYMRIVNPSAAKLIEHGVVYWPPLKRECQVFVYQKTAGERMVPEEKNVALGLSTSQVRSVILPALANVLIDFKDKDFVHGGIRLSNMFVQYEGNKISGVVLGDALTTPQAYSQPNIYLTIQSAIADPIARGQGSSARDIYAFGVSLAMMLRHSDPLAGLSDEDIIKKKIKYGSYGALTGKDRFTGSILELLRGVLQDDFKQRWTADDILTWLEGRRLSPKQNTKANTATRPLDFNGKSFNQLLPLTLEIPKSPQEAVDLCETGRMDQWLERSLEDKRAADNFKTPLAPLMRAEKGKDYNDRLLANMLIGLNPYGPVHYKSRKIMADGLGDLLVAAIERKEDLTVIGQLFSYDILNNSLAVQLDSEMDISGLAGLFDECKKFLKKTKIGFGMERCVYALARQVYCLSPILKEHIAYDPSELLLALDDVAKKGNLPKRFIDRHIAAFLSEKDHKTIDSFLFDLDSSEESRVTLASLSCLATIQARYKIAPVKNLTKALLPSFNVILRNYNDSQTRDKLRKQLEVLAEKGSLIEISHVLNDNKLIALDEQAFKVARHEYDTLVAEEEEVKAKLIDKDEFNKNFGGEISAAISSILAVIIIVLIVLSSAVTGGLSQ